MAKTTATTHTFRLELSGPPGSGKSTFLKFVMRACRQSDEWLAVMGGSHSLTITHLRPPTPKEVKNGI